MSDPTPELVFGSLVLHPPEASTMSGFTIEVSADGTNWGNPQAVVTLIKSLLQDGSLAAVTSHANRTQPIKVRVRADTYDGLAEGEAALMAEVLLERNDLTWRPPTVDAIATVFDVVYGDLAFDFDDLSEEHLERAYTLTLTCAPFARSRNETVISALPVPPASPSTTTIDNANSSTGWSPAVIPGTLSSAMVTGSSGGDFFVGQNVTTTDSAQNFYYSLTRTGAVAMGASPYLRIIMRDLGPLERYFVADGVYLEVVATKVVGDKQYYYLRPQASFNELIIGGYMSRQPPGTWAVLRVYDIARTNELPIFGTSRQRSFTVDVGGSARTQATLEVYTETLNNLGTDTLVYTTPAGSGEVGVDPPLQPWYVSGGTVAGVATNVSGGRVTLHEGPVVFSVPAGRIVEGSYQLMARIASTSLASGELPVLVGWSAYVVDLNGAAHGPGIVGNKTVKVAPAGAYRVVELGIVHLPTVRVDPGTDWRLVFSLTTVEGAYLDEAWLFNLDTGALSWVDTTPQAGPDAEVTALQVKTASQQHPRPEFRISADLARPVSVNADARVKAWGTHTFKSGLVKVFTVTTTATNAVARLRHYRRWHTHART